jgi:hypothetical protein
MIFITSKIILRVDIKNKKILNLLYFLRLATLAAIADTALESADSKTNADMKNEFIVTHFFSHQL